MIEHVRAWLRTYYYVLMPYLVMLALVICGLLYTNYAIHKASHDSEHEMCGLLLPLDQAYRKTPPVTAFGRSFAVELHRQIVERGC